MLKGELLSGGGRGAFALQITLQFLSLRPIIARRALLPLIEMARGRAEEYLMH